MTNAEARFNKSLCPRKPEGSLGRTAQDVHLDSHTAPELWLLLLLVVVMLDLLNAEVLEGTELKEVGGRETILTQHSHHQNDSALTAV